MSNSFPIPGFPPPGRQLHSGPVQVRLLIYREAYSLQGLYLPLPRPSRLRRGLGVVASLIPALFVPACLLLQREKPFSAWHRDLSRNTVTPEALYALAAWLGVFLLQFIFNRAAAKDNPLREGSWAGGLLALPLYALLRGWGIASAQSAIATSAAWLLVTSLAFFPPPEPADSALTAD